MSNAKMPMQPIVVDEGIPHFVANSIVRFLYKAGPFDMNTIMELPGVSREEREQFAQLIGYTVNGFGELGYADPGTVAKADHYAEVLTAKKEISSG